MPVMSIMDRARQAIAAPAPRPLKWVLLESRLLDQEKILLVFDKAHLKEARQHYPGIAIYFPPEVEELRPYTVLREEFIGFFSNLDLSNKDEWYLHSLRKLLQTLMANQCCTSGTVELADALKLVNQTQRTKR